MNQQVIITAKDQDDGSVAVTSQFLPEVKGPSISRSVRLWKVMMESARAENIKPQWMTTYTGRRFFPLDPNPDDICIEDIAHHLANICRFGGATREHYPVAQHCVHVASLVPPDLRRQALMHDAPEAYIGDMVHPLKIAIPKFTATELEIYMAIAAKFGLPEVEPGSIPELKHADIASCMTERRDLLNSGGHEWAKEYETIPPDERKIIPLSPLAAERLFLDKFEEYFQ